MINVKEHPHFVVNVNDYLNNHAFGKGHAFCHLNNVKDCSLYHVDDYAFYSLDDYSFPYVNNGKGDYHRNNVAFYFIFS